MPKYLLGSAKREKKNTKIFGRLGKDVQSLTKHIISESR